MRDRYQTLDLNLLRTLQLLGQELNMRRAADRLFVTQPAVSQSLKKLRHHFDDELFIRVPSGLQATAFTESLLARINPLLDDLSLALNDRADFDPRALAEDLRIVLSPHLIHFLASGLFRSIRNAAPRARVQITHWSPNTVRHLLDGEVLLGVNPELPDCPKTIMSRHLVDDRFTCYVRKGHPLLEQAGQSLPITALDGLEVAHVIVPGWNDRVPRVRSLMRERGLDVRIGFRSTDPVAISEVIRGSDMVFPASGFLSDDALAGLEAFAVEADERILTYPLCAYFHQKHRRNPLLHWLIDLISDGLAQPSSLR